VLTQNREILPELLVEPEGLEQDTKPSAPSSDKSVESDDPLLSLFHRQAAVPTDSFHDELRKQRGLAASAGSA